jgi:choline dehydrogenase-like flavoprotein
VVGLELPEVWRYCQCRADLAVSKPEPDGSVKDFKPDEIHNNIRRMVTTGDKIKREAPTIRHSPTGPARRGAPSPMMNAVGGSSIHYQAQSWRLKPWDFKTVTEVTRRYGKSYIPQGSTVEDWPISYDDLEPYYDITEREVGVSAKLATWQEGSIKREYLRRAAAAGVSDASSSKLRLSRPYEKGRARAGMESVSRARRDQLGALRRARRLRIPWLLPSRRMPSAGEELDLLFHHPEGAANQESDDLRPCAGDAHCGECERKVAGVAPSPTARSIFSPPRRFWSFPIPTKAFACCCFRNRRPILTGWQQ